jgi:hypothetical protein
MVKRRALLLLAVSLRLICVPESRLNADSAAPVSRIRIRVYNYARISNDVLAEAKNSVTAIFLQVHVETQWLACRLSMADTGGDASCQQPFGPTDLVLRILPRLKGDFWHSSAGFSVCSQDSEPGFIANLSYERILAAALPSQVPIGQVLGHVAAHEIGHLLLGTGSHSPTGIMRADWRRQDVQRASQGLLSFSAQQAELIQSALKSRLRD